MTQDVLTRGPAVTASDAHAAAAGNPQWLRDRRLDAWRAYDAMPLPDPGDEEWRRTDVAGIPVEGMRPTPFQTELQLSDEARAAGVVLRDLREALQDSAELIQKHLYSVVPAAEWKYLALNAALWNGGAFLYVPDNAEIAIPVQALTRADRGAVFPRTLIITGRNSRVAFVDEAQSSARRTFVSAAVEIIAGDGSRVDYYDVNRWGADTYVFKTVRAVLGRDAQLTATAAGIGGKLTKMRIDTLMPKSGARAELLGVTFGSDDQHFDYNTLQDHTGDHTISDLQFKSALTDSSSLVWYGITRIRPDAGGSEANQTSRNLLLSDKAKAAPIPILEIEAYDVAKCSHGATVGPVEEGELFYLQARGIPRETAEQMLVEGFLASVTDRIPNAELRDHVTGAILEKLAGGSTARLSADEVLEEGTA